MRRVLALLLLTLGCRVGEAAPDAELRATAVARLTALVGDPDRGVRYAAIQALAKAGEPPDAWGKGIEDAFWCVRQETGWWLRRAGDAAVPVLEKALAKEKPVDVRVSAAWTLSGLGARAAPLLRTALSDPDGAVRVEAVAATRRLGMEHGKALLSEVRAGLAAPDERDAYEAATAVVVLAPGEADDAVPVLARAARMQNQPRNAREAVRALLRAGPAATAVLEELSAISNDWADQIQRLRVELRDEAEERPPSAPPPAASALTPVPVVPADPAEIEVLARVLCEGAVPDRIHAALTLGERRADAARIAPALSDAERDVRMAAAIALGRATGDAVSPLVSALKDANARVRRLAIKSLGTHRAGGEAIAPFLVDPDPATSEEAATALVTIGGAAALPVARQAATGHYGALHHAGTFFDATGEHGGAAVPVLVGMLANDDVNVREYAARCLRAVGPVARDAVPALVRALADDRLCVVANAALALGRNGLSAALVDATADRRARVRAYSAFALGWALGDLRKVDQVPFEVRLPVLDAGLAVADIPTPERVASLADADRTGKIDADGKAALRRGIASADSAIAVRCAALLDHGDLDARESERAMELLLPEGMRRGSPVDFQRVRETLGSSELPAAMMYFCRARENDPARVHVFGILHRSARAEHIPPILWFHRNEEEEALEGIGEIQQPFGYTSRYARETLKEFLGGDVEGDETVFLRAVLRRLVERNVDRLGAPELWLLNVFVPVREDEPLLLALAALIEPKATIEDYQASFLVVLRALGRCSDPASMAFLRRHSRSDTDEIALTALASLARRGDADSIAALVVRTDWVDGLLALADGRPRAAASLLAMRLARPEVIDLFESWSELATRMGVRLSDEAFLGVESAIAERPPLPLVVGRIAAAVPGCATRRLATKVFEQLEPNGGLALLDPREEGAEGDEFDSRAADGLAVFLLAADRERALRFLRRCADHAPDGAKRWAMLVLMRLGDRESAKMIVEWVRSQGRGDVRMDLLHRVQAPEVADLFGEWTTSGPFKGYDSVLEYRARALGWPRDVRLDLSEFAEDKQDGVRAAILAGDLEPVRSAYPVPERLEGRAARGAESWERIGREALRGDRVARAEFWSAMRAGRLRWIHSSFDPEIHTLGRDPSTLPHWMHDLDSNCCRVSDGLGDEAFEHPYGIEALYGTESAGVGRPLSERILEWFRFYGARWVWSPVLDRFVPEPE